VAVKSNGGALASAPYLGAFFGETSEDGANSYFLSRSRTVFRVAASFDPSAMPSIFSQ